MPTLLVMSSGQASEMKTMSSKCVLTCMAAAFAEGVTYPVDFVKTRLQLQGEPGFRGQRYSFSGMALNIARTEGIAGLYVGCSAAIVRHMPYSSFRILAYEYARGFFFDDPATAPILAKAAAGMVFGGMGQAIVVPADVIKVRLQTDGRLVAAGKLAQPRYSGVIDAGAKIMAQDGFIGLYKGGLIAIQRAGICNLGELATYDTAKKLLVDYGFDPQSSVTHFWSGFVSGLVSALTSTPADVAKSRIMSQSRGPDGKYMYRGILHCWYKTVAEEGFFALYKGFFPGWLRLAPWQLSFWLAYERLRIMAGIGSFR